MPRGAVAELGSQTPKTLVLSTRVLKLESPCDSVQLSEAMYGQLQKMARSE